MLSKTILQFLFISLPCTVYSQPNTEQLISSMEALEVPPISIPFTNAIEVNNSGGHLQGIQCLRYNQNNYYILSGSSSEYAYYSIVKTGNANMVISVNKLLDKPFKHAGGFQIQQNLMAIGVEDNEAKNVSKVFIFHITNPEKPPQHPLAIIDRRGTFKRATAGCVGIVTLKGKVLVVVGDWDTEHLDFYRIDEDKLFEEGASLELEYSINTKTVDKSSWVDESWLSYQNINFILDQDENLFLAGMTSNGLDEVVDMYQVESADLSSFKIQKIKSRKFPSNENTKFRWGAGIFVSGNGLQIIATPENIHEQTTLHIYE